MATFSGYKPNSTQAAGGSGAEKRAQILIRRSGKPHVRGVPAPEPFVWSGKKPLKILLATHYFYPSIGGLETVARVLAEQFTAKGHEVQLVTQSPGRAGESDAQFPYPIHRRPGYGELLKLVRWCDLYFQNNISLQTLWPLLVVRRPWVVSHQTWLTRVDGTVGWQDRLKCEVIRYGSPISICEAVAQPLPIPATIIGNPYQSNLFRRLDDVPRERDMVFLARLVSDKGGDLCLEALAELKRQGLQPNLSVVGDGPERGNLERMARDLGVAAQVTFMGMVTGEDLVRTLNRHRIMVVPSRLAEPFGVVALEGAACGCALIGSTGGGLPDAIGPCGLIFENNSVTGLAETMRKLLEDEALCQRLRALAPAHLEKHSPQRIAEAYLHVFEKAMR